MEKEYQLREVLRKKGIGPKGSKSISLEDTENVLDYLKTEGVSLVTKATFLTALLLLDGEPHEKSLILKLQQGYQNLLQKELWFFFQGPNNQEEEIILKLIHKKDLSPNEIQFVNVLLFTNSPDYYKASILEGERLKRETFQENLGFFKGFLEQVKPLQTQSYDQIVLLAESFDGWVRNSIFTAFSLPVLAKLGKKVYTIGTEKVAPKEGFTTHQLLKKLGENVFLSAEEVMEKIERDGWGYLDVSQFAPSIYKLNQMRYEMVKRPFIATFEKLLAPIRNSEGKVSVVGAYTHSHYKLEVVKLMKEFSFVDKFVHLKGVEATTQPKLAGETEYVLLENGELKELEFELNFSSDFTKHEISLEHVRKLGLGALKGEKNEAYFKILAQCTFVLVTVFGETFSRATEQVCRVLDTSQVKFSKNT